MTWQSSNESVLRGYKFAYDGVNRLTSSTYGEGGSIASNVNRYNENMSYDKMGNILSIERYGKLTPSTFGLIDDLSLSYDGNQLRKVSDAAASGTDPQEMHFTDGADALTEYTYDGNGNLTSDLNLGIRKIEYNPLNLPQKILFSDGDSIRYLYGADGTKLCALHTIGGITSRTDYAGNRIYADGRLDKILTEEGYIDFTGSTPVYHYFLTDHLGNNRVVLNQDGSVEQVNHYYPFGSLMAESTGGEVQPWKFGGKELDMKKGVNWADFGMRYYGSSLGRWSSIDPMSENYYSASPYAYCENNPANRIDPNGEDWYEDEDGNVHWNRSQDAEYTDDNGKTWKNIGSCYLYVNKGQAILFQQTTDENNELHLSSEKVELDTSDPMVSVKNTVLNMQNSSWSREAAQKFWDSPTLGNWFSYVGKEILSQYTNPELVVNGLAVGVAGYSTLWANKRYAPKAFQKGIIDKAGHNFPFSFDDAILSTKPIPRPGGYYKYRLRGSINGKEGFFEIGRDKYGIIDHRCFKSK